MGAEGLAVGVDLGGTKIAAGVFEPDGRLLGALAVEPTLADGPAEGSREALLGVVDGALAAAGIDSAALEGIGVGSPGPLAARSGTLLEIPTLPGLHYFPLRGTLQQRYGTRVEISNDGNCFALGEALYGAARAESVVLGVTMGTGCGAGLVVDGRIHEGATFNAGEVYRAPCGERTFDEVLSGPGLEQLYFEQVGVKRAGAEISELARNGDPAAGEVFEAFGVAVARGLGILAAVLDPQVVVLGGGVAAAFDCFEGVLKREIVQYIAPGAAEQLRIVASEAGASPGAAGAAALVFSSSGREG